MDLQKIFLTFFGSGLGDRAPGTMGTLAAIPVGVAILYYFGMPSLFLVTLAITIIGVIEVNKYEKKSGVHDDKHIVVDEVVGIWITIMIAASTMVAISFPYAQTIALTLSFLTFRLFDIWKPSTIGTIDKKWPGGLGVMLDDVLAGVAAGALTAALLRGISWLYANLL